MKFFLLLPLFFLLSCSILIDIDESNLDNPPISPVSQKNICLNNQPTLKLLGGDKELQKQFSNFISRFSHKEFKKIDIAVMWTLVLMRQRPDVISPTSRIQSMLTWARSKPYWTYSLIDQQKRDEDLKLKGIKKKANSYLQNNKEDIRPLLYGLQDMLLNFRSKYDLWDLAGLLENSFRHSIKVSKALGNFLVKNKAKIAKENHLKDYYFRGEDVLTFGENLPFISYRTILGDWQPSNHNQNRFKVDVQEHLFHKEISSTTSVSCNFDLGLYENSIYILNNSKFPATPLGVQFADGHSFMSVISQDTQKIVPFKKSAFFSGDPNIRSSNLCLVHRKTRENPARFIFSSLNSRDPAQIIYQYLKHDLDSLKSIQDLEVITQGSRYLYLNNPVRLMVESERIRSERLTKLLTLDIPVYHSKAIGGVYIHSYFPRKKEVGFISDPRYPMEQLCPLD